MNGENDIRISTVRAVIIEGKQIDVENFHINGDGIAQWNDDSDGIDRECWCPLDCIEEIVATFTTDRLDEMMRQREEHASTEQVVIEADGAVPILEEHESCTDDLHYHRLTVEHDDGTTVTYLRDHDFRPE